MQRRQHGRVSATIIVGDAGHWRALAALYHHRHKRRAGSAATAVALFL